MFARRLLPFVVIAALAAFGTAPAQAGLVNITNKDGALVGDVSLGDLGNNSPSTSFNWLAGKGAFLGEGVVDGYNALTGAQLPVPLFEDYFDAGSASTVDVTGYHYAVLHYGKGNDGKGKSEKGQGQGGGIVAYYLHDAVGLLTLPTKGLGPNGFGGLSSVRLYRADRPVTVPDSGGSLLLLGASLAGVVWLAKRRKA